jgi:hypothetical protein
MFVRIWRFTVSGADREGFEKAYGEQGDWARLFARSPHFRGTELLRDCDRYEADELAYITVDRWREQGDWSLFLEEHGDDYRALDLECEALTVGETRIGNFVSE